MRTVFLWRPACQRRRLLGKVRYYVPLFKRSSSPAVVAVTLLACGTFRSYRRRVGWDWRASVVNNIMDNDVLGRP